jgi:hypothetical protein
VSQSVKSIKVDQQKPTAGYWLHGSPLTEFGQKPSFTLTISWLLAQKYCFGHVGEKLPRAEIGCVEKRKIITTFV